MKTPESRDYGKITKQKNILRRTCKYMYMVYVMSRTWVSLMLLTERTKERKKE
jgi:hypothetical protein